MRPFVYLAAIPFVLGCAQQSVVRAPALPSDEPLQVRLYQPTAGALNYQLSEPAYVAIFAVTRGHGISLVFPYYESQMYYPSHAGLNQETVHGGSSAWGYSAGSRNEHRALFGYADAYYVIASKYPLSLEGMIQSPYLLRSLVGSDLFRATNLSDTWDALESILVAGLPDDTWAADVYLNWRDPFMAVSWEPRRFLQDCSDGRSFLSVSLLNTGRCDMIRRTASVPPIPLAELPRRSPPREPLDRDPSVPMPPDEGIVRASRSGSEVIRRERSRRDAQSDRAETGRASDRSRGESARAADREVTAIREQAPAPAPSRAVESRPQQQTSRPDGQRPEPPPDP